MTAYNIGQTHEKIIGLSIKLNLVYIVNVD